MIFKNVVNAATDVVCGLTSAGICTSAAASYVVMGSFYMRNVKGTFIREVLLKDGGHILSQ